MTGAMDASVVQELRHQTQELLDIFTESHQSGGSYMTAGNRWLLLGLAQSMHAKDILETGYNTGLTTLTLALSGAQVVGVDNLYEQPDVEELARMRLAHFANVRLVQEDALLFLVRQLDESYDLIFIDDCHWPAYTKLECVEILRLLRPGGCAVFHDTFYADLWSVINETFPLTWQRLNCPSWQRGAGYSGVAGMAGHDLGLGIVRKPWVHAEPSVSMAECLQMDATTDGRIRPKDGEDHAYMVATYLQVLRKQVPLADVPEEQQASMEAVIRGWGKYCSECASFSGYVRYWGPEEVRAKTPALG